MMGILNFELKFGRKVLSRIRMVFWVIVNRFPTYGRSSNFQHWMGGG